MLQRKNKLERVKHGSATSNGKAHHSALGASSAVKLLLIVPSLARGGGAEKNAAMLATALSKKFSTTLLTFVDFVQEYPYSGKRISFSESKTTNYFGKLSRLFTRAKKIKALCRREHFTHVISFMEEAGFPLAVSKILGNKAFCVTSLRTHPRWYATSPAYARGISHLYPKLDAVIVQTKDAAQYLFEKHRISQSKIAVIANILEPSIHTAEKISRAYIEFTKSGFIFGTVGRLSWEKNHIGLICAFAQVVEKNENAKLIIVGEGPLRSDIEALIKEKKMQNNVLLAGVTKNVPGYLALFDCFVFTSSIEGFPNGILEALAAGLPIVSTDCRSGPRDILCPSLAFAQSIKYPHRGEYGTLVQVLGDSHVQNEVAHAIFAKELCRAMKITNSARLLISKRNKLRAKSYEPNMIANKWLETLK